MMQCFSLLAAALLLAAGATRAQAQGQDAGKDAGKVAGKDKALPDSITFTNGDHLTGKLVREDSGKVTFHSDIAGDVSVSWDKVKELHATAVFAVLQKGVLQSRKLGEAQIPAGTLAVENGVIELQSATTTDKIQPIAVANAAYIIDKPTLDKQLLGHPGFFAAWNGSATGGATVVSATQNQYTVNAAVALQRIVPTVSWLAPRNRTTANFNESFGKITQPAYTLAANATAAATFVPAVVTKSNIFHADAERDEYLSQRLYTLGSIAFDHNYAQSLQLQQIYGAGFGYTPFKRPKQELDVKAIAQYEKQTFFNSASANQNLIAATVAANYNLTLPRGILFNQQISYIPAFNNVRAYSADETDALTFPAYKSFGFTVGSLDSYLNDAPVTEPLTKRNSFQFTVGLTYAIKSNY